MKELIKLLEKQGFQYSIDEWYFKEDIIADYFVNTEMFTEEEINLVSHINGWSVKTLNEMLFVRYGYRDLQQMLEED